MIYTLIRSKRKTLALYVRNGDIEVRAPLRMSKREIEKFITSKQKWILDNIKKQNQRENQRDKFHLDYGGTVLCRGRSYLVTAKTGSRASFDDEHFYVPADLTQEQIKQACVKIYRKIAKQELTDRTHGYSKLLSVTPAAVKINSAKSRWGSCSAKKSINYSWRLIMADDEVIDYVVVHELAHIIELNHSIRFWAIVENIFPNFRERKKRLKELQTRLNNEDWD